MNLDYPPLQKPYTRNGEILQPGIFPPGMQRVALGVEYNGAALHGFQRQPGEVATVQAHLERALSKVADEPIALVCAGRTDAGVHATNQIIHFDTLAQRPQKAWTRGVNALLPDTVSVRWALPVSEFFHARFSAVRRTYRYIVYNAPTRPALGFDQLTWVRERLDQGVMYAASRALLGEHDFSSFRAAQCQARSPVRQIEYLDIARRGELLVFEVQANAFLQHMVRNLVGVLLAIGKAEQPVNWAAQVLQARDRKKAGVTAKSNGLYLVAVGYSNRFRLPESSPGPLFVNEPLGGFARTGCDAE